MGAPQLTLNFEKMTLFNDNRVNYSKYSKFINVEDFNNQWEQFMLDYKHQFTKLQLDAIRVYREFGTKEGRVGVVNASYRTLMEAAEKKYTYKISRDTFRQAIQKLEKLGGCVVADGQRLVKGRGSRTANIVIFNRFDEAVAYQVQQKKKQDEEIARLLEENYAAATPVINYAYNARKWAEEKQLRQAEQAAKKAAEQAQKEREAAEQAAKHKKVSLYRKIAVLLSNKKSLQSLNLNEFVAIAYSNVKKLVAANVEHTDAEEIAYKKLVEVSEKDNVKNYAALYSWTMKQAVMMLNGEIKTMTKEEIALKQGNYVERKPDWFAERENDALKREKMKRSSSKAETGNKVSGIEKERVVIDFEAEAAKARERIEKLQEQ